MRRFRCTTDHFDSRAKRLRKRCDAAGLPLAFLPMQGRFDFVMAARLASLITQYGAQVVHAHKGREQALAFWTSCFTPIPALVANRGVSFPVGRLRALKYRYRTDAGINVTGFPFTARSLDEAAWIDGAGVWDTLLRIHLPLAAPGLAATAVFCFLFSWNDFFFALILTRTKAVTAPVAVVNFLNYEGWEWGKIAAAGTIHKGEVLTTWGPYAHLRHPLYAGSFLIGGGLAIAGGSCTSLAPVRSMSGTLAPPLATVTSSPASTSARASGPQTPTQQSRAVASASWTEPSGGRWRRSQSRSACVAASAASRRSATARAWSWGNLPSSQSSNSENREMFESFILYICLAGHQKIHGYGSHARGCNLCAAAGDSTLPKRCLICSRQRARVGPMLPTGIFR